MKVLIPTFSTLELIEIDEIIVIQADDNYSKILLDGGLSIKSTNSLGKFYEELHSLGFYQTHKSYIINLEKILRYHKTGQVEMEDGSMIPVARRRKEEFLERIALDVDINERPSSKNINR